jgi:tetratricopeptide (TPR) repeat protein
MKLPDVDKLIKDVLNKSLELLQQDNTQDAEVLLQQLLRVDSENLGGLQLLGLIKYKNRHCGEAIRLFTEALKHNPKNSENHNNISLCYSALGFIDKAIEHMKKAIEIEPERCFYYSNLGLHYRKKGLVDKAEECDKKVADLNSEH